MNSWILLGVSLLMKPTSSENNVIIPVAIDPQKRKDTNINVEVNLGLGGNCTATDIVTGNCARYSGNTGTPLVLTRYPFKPTSPRKFEKYGEYIKVNLCSYEYDNARSCQGFCDLLGYVNYACSDLELCHCWNAPVKFRGITPTAVPKATAVANSSATSSRFLEKLKTP